MMDPTAPVDAIRNRLAGNKAFLLLLVLSFVLAETFVFRGFATEDSIRYAIGIKEVSAKGLTHLRHVFNGEMCTGYFILFHLIEKVFGTVVDLAVLMNQINALASVALYCGLFRLFQSILDDKTISFFSCIAILLAPSIWFLSHYGNPGLLSLTFFVFSLISFDALLTTKTNQIQFVLKSLLFLLLATISILFRFDIILSFGVYFGLLYYRKILNIKNLCTAATLIFGVFLSVLFLRFIFLGYFLSDSDGTVSRHVSTRLETANLLRNIIKNSVLWTMATGPLITLIAILGLVRIKDNIRLFIFGFTWIAPWCLFLVFRNMDFGRIVAPTIPSIAFFAMTIAGSTFKKNRIRSLCTILVIAQLVSIFSSSQIVRVYPFKTEVNGRVLASLPLGFLPVDHYFRQLSIDGFCASAQQIATVSDSDVLIFGGSGLMYYYYEILQRRDVLVIGERHFEGIVAEYILTPENEFTVMDLTHNWLEESPIRRSISLTNIDAQRVHFVPFWKEYPVDASQLFLTEKLLQDVLENESRVMAARRKMISH